MQYQQKIIVICVFGLLGLFALGYILINKKTSNMDAYYTDHTYANFRNGHLNLNDYETSSKIAEKQIEEKPEPKVLDLPYTKGKPYWNWNDYKIEKQGILKDGVLKDKPVQPYPMTGSCYKRSGTIPLPESGTQLAPNKEIYTNNAQEILVWRF